MSGGITIDSKRTAAAVARFPEMEGEDVRPGLRVKVAPCVPPHMLAVIRAREGRPCPKVDLQPENTEPAELFTMLSREETRGIVPEWIDLNLSAFSSEEKARLLNRAVYAIHNERITELVRQPAPQQQQEAN